jgi:hypothetical protein
MSSSDTFCLGGSRVADSSDHAVDAIDCWKTIEFNSWNDSIQPSTEVISLEAVSSTWGTGREIQSFRCELSYGCMVVTDLEYID